MRKVLKIAARILGFLLVSVVVGYSLFLANAKYIMHEQLPMLGGYGYAIVLSGSMEPVISVNDVVIVKSQDSYEPGDIITYADEDGTLITHRIVSIDDDEVIVRGDANNTNDPAFSVDSIKGAVVAIIPKVGYLVKLMQQPIFMLCAVALAFFLMERSYSKEEKEKTQDIDDIKAEIARLKGEDNSAAAQADSTAETADGSETKTES